MRTPTKRKFQPQVVLKRLRIEDAPVQTKKLKTAEVNPIDVVEEDFIADYDEGTHPGLPPSPAKPETIKEQVSALAQPPTSVAKEILEALAGQPSVISASIHSLSKQLTLKHLGFSGVIERLEATIHQERQTTRTNTDSVHQLKQEVRDLNHNINKITNVMDRMEGTLNRVVSKLNSFDTKIGISLAGAATSLDAFSGIQCCNHKSITDSCCTALHSSQEGAVGYRGSIKHKLPSI